LAEAGNHPNSAQILDEKKSTVYIWTDVAAMIITAKAEYMFRHANAL
jgi:hypothetical protein